MVFINRAGGTVKALSDCWYLQSLLLANGSCFLLLCPLLTHFQFSCFPAVFYPTHLSTSKIILFLCLLRTFCCHHPGLSTLQTHTPDSTDLDLPTRCSPFCSCAFSFFCPGSRTAPCNTPHTHNTPQTPPGAGTVLSTPQQGWCSVHLRTQQTVGWGALRRRKLSERLSAGFLFCHCLSPGNIELHRIAKRQRVTVLWIWLTYGTGLPRKLPLGTRFF